MHRWIAYDPKADPRILDAEIEKCRARGWRRPKRFVIGPRSYVRMYREIDRRSP